eukprot:scaffold3076_cov117-Isochrysis_galbana.AAC.4
MSAMRPAEGDVKKKDAAEARVMAAKPKRASASAVAHAASVVPTKAWAAAGTAWSTMPKTPSVQMSTPKKSSPSHAHDADQYAGPETPETNCICLEPDSRSRNSGVTKSAPTNANGTKIMMEAKTAMMDESVASWRLE